MNDFTYFMPARILFGKDCVVKNSAEFKKLGSKALIFTGRNSAKINGSLDDVTTALEAQGMGYVVFNEVEENPSLETVERASKIGIEAGADFVIGIGGGSPMDAAKGASFLIKNPDLGIDMLMSQESYQHAPVVEIATTAGTGSEVTQYAIFTLHDKGTKSASAQKTFADLAFLDAKYTMSLSDRVTINTAIDALTHLIEGYMSTKASYLSDRIAETGLRVFAECIESLKERNFPEETREKLLLMSTIAGMVIAQTGSSLPHACGYMLTYEKNIAHGRANAIFMRAYLEMFSDKTKVNTLLDILGFGSIEEFCEFLKNVLDKREDFTEDELDRYVDSVMKDAVKLQSFPGELNRDDIYDLHKKSLILY